MKQAENKFIVVTDMREAVGVEEVVGRKVVIAVDHIVKIEAVEKHIAEHLNYSSTIHNGDSKYRDLEGHITSYSIQASTTHEQKTKPNGSYHF